MTQKNNFLFKIGNKSKLCKLLKISRQELRLFCGDENYRVYKEPKHNGTGFRTIEAPAKKLKSVQRKINKELQKLSVPDYLCSGIKGKSFIDNALAHIISTVDKRIGLNNALFVLTSTGYADVENADLSAYRIPTGTFDVQRSAALLNMYLVAVYGQGLYVESCFDNQIYLNHKLIESKQINMTEMLNRCQDLLLQLSGVKDVYTSQRLLQGAWTPGISRIRGGYNPRFSGDILLEVSPGWSYTSQNNAKPRLVRESYLSYPVIFFGYGIPSDTIGTPVTVDYIAPTLSKAMRIRAPNACSLAPLF